MIIAEGFSFATAKGDSCVAWWRRYVGLESVIPVIARTRQIYEYVGMPIDKAIGRRGRGMYFLFHEVTEEAACNLLRSDRDARMELAQMGK